MEDCEKRIIIKTLNQETTLKCTAEKLGVSLSTLWRKSDTPPQGGWLDELGRFKGDQLISPNVELKHASVS